MLTERQERVIDLFIRGYSQKQIADRLHISPDTVSTHMKAIHKALNIHSETELLRISLTAKIRNISSELMAARSNSELNMILWANSDLFEEVPDLFKRLHLARKRINRVRKEKWNNTELEFKN